MGNEGIHWEYAFALDFISGDANPIELIGYTNHLESISLCRDRYLFRQILKPAR